MSCDATSHDPPAGELDPRVVFAAERTLLAWVRTSLAIAGLGFVIARFGLFGGDSAPRPIMGRELSELAGVLLITVGVLVNVAASVGHVRFMRRYYHGVVHLPRPVSLAVVLAGFVAVLGVALVWYLLRMA